MITSSIRYAQGIGVANVDVTSVFWGSNQLDPSAAHPGDVNLQFSIVLTNVGDDVARGVNVTLFLDTPLQYTYYLEGKEVTGSSVSKFAGDIIPGSSYIVSFTFNIDPNAQEGTYRYPLQISYKSARELQRINKMTTIDVPIWKGDLQIQNVITLPTKIFPGNKEVQIKAILINSGIGSISDVYLKMDLKSPFIASSSGSDNIYLGNLPTGGVSEADFIIDIEDTAQFGQYPIVLIQESESSSIPIGEIPLYINEKVKFEIIKVTPVEFHPGDTGKIVQVEVKNVGSVKAESVRVQLRVGNFFSGTLTDFLGTMSAGEVKSAFFTVDIDSKASIGEYNFDLRIDWTQDGYVLDDTLIVSSKLEPQSFSYTPFMIGILILIIIAGVVLIRRRRTKRRYSSPK
jgi:hypothetical protein